MYNKSRSIFRWIVIMIRLLLLLLSFLFISTACSEPVLPMAQDETATATRPLDGITPDLPALPTEEPIEEDAGGYARAFYSAW